MNLLNGNDDFHENQLGPADERGMNADTNINKAKLVLSALICVHPAANYSLYLLKIRHPLVTPKPETIRQRVFDLHRPGMVWHNNPDRTLDPDFRD